MLDATNINKFINLVLDLQITVNFFIITVNSFECWAWFCLISECFEIGLLFVTIIFFLIHPYMCLILLKKIAFSGNLLLEHILFFQIDITSEC